MEDQPDPPSPEPIAQNPMPDTPTLPSSRPTSSVERSAPIIQRHYHYPQESTWSQASSTQVQYSNQPAISYLQPGINEHSPTIHFGYHSVSYQDTPATYRASPPQSPYLNPTAQRFSPPRSPYYNPAAIPFFQPRMSDQDMASSIGSAHVPQNDQPILHPASPAVQDAPAVSPQRTQYNPNAPEFSSPNLTAPVAAIASSSDANIQGVTTTPRGISLIRLPRPNRQRVQHSPPRRPFHDASSPPKTPGAGDRDVRLRSHLKDLQERKKQVLYNYHFSGKEVAKSRKQLDAAWESEAASQHQEDLYAMQTQLTALIKQYDDFGREYERLGEEIEEAFGDFYVPGESEVE